MPPSTYIERQKLFIKFVELELMRVHGSNIRIKDFDLGNQAVCNIVDHHDILNHPLFLSPNIVGNLSRFFEISKKSKAIISITDSGLSVSHFGNRRSLKFKDTHLRLFTHKMRNINIYSSPTHNTFNLGRQIRKYTKNKKEAIFIDTIEEILHKYAEKPHINSYIDQVSLTNRYLWKKLFDEKIRSNVPELFQIPGESIATSLLATYLEQPNHIFSKILFDEDTRNLVVKLFSGIDGCWHPNLEHGTHFFWAIDAVQKAQRLRIEGNNLVSLDESIRIPLTKENILNSLKHKKIYPNLFLVYSVLIFYCGIKPLVGGRSRECISLMKEQWQKIVLPEEAAFIKRIETDNLVQVGTFYKYALDIIYEGGLGLKDIKKLEARRKAQVWMSQKL